MEKLKNIPGISLTHKEEIANKLACIKGQINNQLINDIEKIRNKMIEELKNELLKEVNPSTLKDTYTLKYARYTDNDAQTLDTDIKNLQKKLTDLKTKKLNKKLKEEIKSNELYIELLKAREVQALKALEVQKQIKDNIIDENEYIAQKIAEATVKEAIDMWLIIYEKFLESKKIKKILTNYITNVNKTEQTNLKKKFKEEIYIFLEEVKKKFISEIATLNIDCLPIDYNKTFKYMLGSLLANVTTVGMIKGGIVIMSIVSGWGILGGVILFVLGIYFEVYSIGSIFEIVQYKYKKYRLSEHFKKLNFDNPDTNPGTNNGTNNGTIGDNLSANPGYMFSNNPGPVFSNGTNLYYNPNNGNNNTQTSYDLATPNNEEG